MLEILAVVLFITSPSISTLFIFVSMLSVILGNCIVRASSPFDTSCDIQHSQTDAINVKNNEIELIFRELNELALLSAQGAFLQDDLDDELDLAKIESRVSDLELRLEQLNVHKINPDNENDMRLLSGIVLNDEYNAQKSSASNIPSPPELSAIANYYSIYHQNGTYKVNGTSYNYSFIRVVDNKGYNTPLTCSKVCILTGKTNSTLSNLLKTQFSLGLSAYLGTTSNGWVIDWTLSSIFSVLNSYSSSSGVTYINGRNIYQTLITSVTQMLYCYVYSPSSGWQLCGVKSPQISYARSDTFAGNIGGKAVVDSYTYPSFTSSTGIAPTSYVSNYITNGVVRVDYAGSFRVNGLGGLTTTFTPGFYRNYLDLVLY